MHSLPMEAWGVRPYFDRLQSKTVFQCPVISCCACMHEVHAAGSGSGSLDTLKEELSMLEAERDEAVATAESSAASAVKLTEMVGVH